MFPKGVRSSLSFAAVSGFAATAALLSVGPSWSAREPPRAPEGLCRDGLRAYAAGDVGGAVAHLRQALDSAPANPFCLFALARVYHEEYAAGMTAYGEAVNLYERLATILGDEFGEGRDPALYEMYFHQGSLLMRGCDYGRAERAFLKYLKLFPGAENAPEAVNAIGVANYYTGQFDRAVARFREALEVRPRYAAARFNLRSVFTRMSLYAEALALHRAGDLDGALEKLKTLLEFSPRFPAGRQLLANLLFEKGETDRALALCRRLLDEVEDVSVLYAVRTDAARMHLARGEREPAQVLLLENVRQFSVLGDDRLRLEVLQLLAEALEGER
jgi:tetratricopeptide (TPR) repeat protein